MRPHGLATGFAAYAGQGWEEAEARQIAVALTYAAEKCKLHKSAGPLLVRLEGNHFGDMGERLIKAAVKFGKIFAAVRL